MLAAWEANDLYAKIRAISRGPAALRAARRPAVRQRRRAPRSLREQGAQGHRGQVAPARRLRLAVHPGWDCHGLPIEHQIEKKFGRVGNKLNAKEFRAACRKFAQEQVELQRADFKRFGVLGDWNNPYRTMDPRFEAQQVAFARQGDPQRTLI
jgi:isoleucyl-tRNA synthetase